MSIRKRPTNLIDKFDSRDYGSGYQKPILAQQPIKPEKHTHVANLNLYQGMDMMHVLLKDYQARFIVGESEKHLYFPNVWFDLASGDRIKNLDTNEVYVVDEVITTNAQYPKNYVRITATQPPQPYEMLRLDDNQNKTVDIIPAEPDTPMKPYSFTADGHLQNNTDQDITTWKDVITYTTWEYPGSLNGKMLEKGVLSAMRPRYVEEIADEVDGPAEHYTQQIDGRVRLDFWTRSNANSQKMLLWFREFYQNYYWIMEANGLERVIWLGDYTATEATRSVPGTVHRSSEIGIRTAYSFSRSLAKIRTAEFSITIPRDTADPTMVKDLVRITIS